nr:hypothetical protein [Tanacetum cinerariifolium]
MLIVMNLFGKTLRTRLITGKKRDQDLSLSAKLKLKKQKQQGKSMLHIPESAKKKSGGRSSKRVIQDTPSTPKSKPATLKTKLKDKQKTTWYWRLNEGTGSKAGVLDEDKDITNEKEYGIPIPETMLREAIKQSESYQMFIKSSTGQIPPKKSRGKGKKTSSKRRIKKKVTLSADDNIIFDDPDSALELGKSISLTEAEEVEATRKVDATHARIVTKFVLEPTRRRKSEIKKTSRMQPGTGGSSEGTGTIPGVPDEEKVISEEKVILEWGSEEESEYYEDLLDDKEKDDKDGDADDEGNDHISDTQDADDEDAETKSDEDEIYKYKISKADAEKTSDVKDDANKAQILLISSSLAVSSDHKRKHDNDDEEPLAGPNQGKKTKRRRTKESKSSKKPSSTKETPKGKTPSKDSKTGKFAFTKELVEEPIAEVVMDDMGNDVVRDDDQPKDASEPKIAKTLNLEWLKKPPRLPTPDPEWNKHQVVLDQPKQPWFNQVVFATKDPLRFNDLMATLIDFSKYTSDPEVTYTTSITKTKAARYEIKGIEDMVPTLWSPIIVGYDKDALNGIKHWGERRKLWYRSHVNKFSKHNVYSTKEILGMKSVSVNKLYRYGHLEDIEDMLLLSVQHKLFHLDDSDIVDFIVALQMVMAVEIEMVMAVEIEIVMAVEIEMVLWCGMFGDLWC